MADDLFPNPPRIFLITGGTGTLGTALTRRLLSEGHKVRVLARSEHGHERLRQAVEPEYLGNLSSLIGNVEDRERLKRSLKGIEFVIHAAAQKIVPLCEYNPLEAIQTNIMGTSYVLSECLAERACGVRRAAFVSSDKACAASTLYGQTKAVAERLWLNGNRYSAGQEPHFVGVRYGNVWGSQGSVLHAWQKQAQFGHIEVTDPQSTRFHIKIEAAVELVLRALSGGEPGELWVPKLPSYRLGDLATAFCRVFNLPQAPQITGLRLAEKLHESMISGDESCSLRETHSLSNNFVLEPGVIHQKGGFSYTSGSNTHRLSVADLTEEVKEWANL